MFYIPHISEIIQYFSFCDCLITLSIMSSRFSPCCDMSQKIPSWYFFLLVYWIYQPTVFWSSMFLIRNQLKILLSILCMWQITSLTAFKMFFAFWQFYYNVSRYAYLNSFYLSLCESLNSFYLKFELLGCLYSCLWSNLANFWTLLIPIFFYIFLSLFLFQDFHNAYVGLCDNIL